MMLVLWSELGDLVTVSEHLPGFDTYYHVAIVDEAIDRVRAGYPVGPLAESINGGVEYLYDTETKYPQFAYMVSVVIGSVVGSASKTYGLLMENDLFVSNINISHILGKLHMPRVF